MQQTTAFQDLKQESQIRFLNLFDTFTASNQRIEARLDEQSMQIERHHEDTARNTIAEGNALRQYLNVENEQTRNHVSNLKENIDQASEDLRAAQRDSAVQIMSMSTALQNEVMDTITLNQETVKEDVNGLQKSLVKLGDEMSLLTKRFEKLVQQLNSPRRDKQQLRELQSEGNDLASAFLSLQSL